MIPVSLFVISIAFLLYVLFGYPLLLGLLVRLRPKPVRRHPSTPTVSVLIAVHNGEAFVEAKLRSLANLHYPPEKLEVILVCDGCTDRTADVARQLRSPRLHIVSQPRAGKPAALNQAMRIATGEVFFFTDIRQEVDPDCLRLLVESLADPTVGAVSGRLVIRQGDSHQEANIGLYWKYEFWLRAQLSTLDSFFGATGACYILRRELAVEIPAPILLDDMYEPLAAFFRGYRLIADDRARVYDQPTKLDAEFKRKVRTLSGNYQVIAAYPRLLGPANRLWFHFVSYKFARLALPFALLLLAASSFGLPFPWSAAAIAAQAAFYGLALLDSWIPKTFPLKPLSSIARTFSVMMLATLSASRTLFGRSTADLWAVPTGIAPQKNLPPGK